MGRGINTKYPKNAEMLERDRGSYSSSSSSMLECINYSILTSVLKTEAPVTTFLLLARNGLVRTPRVVLYRVVIPCDTKRTQTVAVERIHSYGLAATGTY